MTMRVELAGKISVAKKPAPETLSIVREVCPYEDGSGHAYKIELLFDDAGKFVTRIRQGGEFVEFRREEDWRAVRDAINRAITAAGKMAL